MKFSLSLAVILVLCSCNFALAASTEAADHFRLLNEASDYYSMKKYDKAIDIYLALLKDGYESPSLYFNIANSYLYRGESIGRAVFYYEVARQMMPRDRDIALNLRYAKSLIRQDRAPHSENLAIRYLRMAFDLFSIREAFIIWNIFYFMAAIFIVASLFVANYKNHLRILAAIFFVITVVTLYPLGEKMQINEYLGVVIHPNTKALYEPFNNTPTKFDLHEGSQVRILKQIDDWYKIKRSNGQIGWVKKKDILTTKKPI